MDTKPAFGFKELFHHVIGDMAKALCERNGDTQAQQYARSQAVVHMILGFLPRDVIEAMLAGHCVLFHELIIDSARDTLRGEAEAMRRSTRAGIVAMDKAFGNNLRNLERYQARPADGRRDEAEQPAEAAGRDSQIAAQEQRAVDVPVPAPMPSARRQATPVAEAEIAHAGAQASAVRNQSEALAVHIVKTALQDGPSPAAIAACRANPEAMAALEAGDAEGFARAMGIDMPSVAFLNAAAAKGSPFDRHGASARAAAIASGRVKV